MPLIDYKVVRFLNSEAESGVVLFTVCSTVALIETSKCLLFEEMVKGSTTPRASKIISASSPLPFSAEGKKSLYGHAKGISKSRPY